MAKEKKQQQPEPEVVPIMKPFMAGEPEPKVEMDETEPEGDFDVQQD